MSSKRISATWEIKFTTLSPAAYHTEVELVLPKDCFFIIMFGCLAVRFDVCLGVRLAGLMYVLVSGWQVCYMMGV